MKIEVKDNNIEQALRVLKRKLQRDGFFKVVKLKSVYEKPSKKKKRILRNALIRLSDAHIKVCATVHDAFLIECPIPESEDQIRVAIKCMTDAARYIVGGENYILVDTEKYFYTFNKQGQDKNGIYKTIFEEINKYKKQKTWSGTVAKHGHEGIC